MEWLISTPRFHHRHHTLAEPRDRNFASMLPVLDLIFGTYYLPRKEWPGAYGTAAPMPGSVVGQLVHPFRAPPPRIGMPEGVATER
ncbi:MAG: sterol desaturase family protein [Stellaceae bacterium]